MYCRVWSRVRRRRRRFGWGREREKHGEEQDEEGDAQEQMQQHRWPSRPPSLVSGAPPYRCRRPAPRLPHPRGTRPQQVPPHQRQGLRAAARLTELTLSETSLSEAALQSALSSCPAIRTLILKYVHGLQRIRVCSCGSLVFLGVWHDHPVGQHPKCCSTERLLHRGLTSVSVLQS